MAAVPTSFYCLWQDGNIRETLFSMLPKEDLASVRAANTACCNLITKRLFLRTHITFTPNTFTRPSRVQALSRIGHHIEHLTFYFPHGENTFLPPLVHPLSGHEITFLYTPHTSMGSVLTRPKYTNSDLGEILKAQYPPLFHAATNVPSFIIAMKNMPNMRHLTVKTPGQDATERYRRDIVDYALISLRVSLERAPLPRLSKLSLTAVHPGAFLYLRPLFALGCRPSAGRKWKQIRKLNISVESWDFYGHCPGIDQLKIIDDYIRGFSSSLEKVSFTWLGRRGPCPLALGGDPLCGPPKSSKKLFNEVTSPMSPLPPPPVREQMKFPRLKFLQVRNATMNAPQVAMLVAAHRENVREFDFNNVALTRGTWDEALAPLSEKAVSRSSRGSYQGLCSKSEIWNRSVANLESGGYSGGSFRSISEEELPTPSAAAEAASRDLLDEELERSLFGLMGQAAEVDAKRDEILDWAAKTPIPDVDGRLSPSSSHREATEARDDGDEYDTETVSTPPSAPVTDFTHLRPEWLDEEEIAAAREANEAFSTNVKKRKVKKRRRRRRDGREEDSGYDTEKTEKSTRSSSSCRPRRRKPSHGGGEEPQDKQQRSISRSRSHRKRPESIIPEVPEIPPGIPEVVDDEHVVEDKMSEVLPPLPLLVRSNTTVSARSNGSSKSMRSFRSLKSFKSLRSRPSISEEEVDDTPPTPPTMVISDPVMATSDEEPSILLLQPTVYDPKGAAVGRESIHEITAVQRDIEAEEQHRMLAEDEGMRSNALRKAKEIVLSKLSREFSVREEREKAKEREREEKCAVGAVRRRLMDYTFGHCGNGGHAAEQHTRQMPTRNWWGGKSVVSVASECRTLDSQSAVVPLIISR